MVVADQCARHTGLVELMLSFDMVLSLFIKVQTGIIIFLHGQLQQ